MGLLFLLLLLSVVVFFLNKIHQITPKKQAKTAQKASIVLKYSEIHAFCAKSIQKPIKNEQKSGKGGKKAGKNRNFREKSLGKMLLIHRVVRKKFTKKMKKSLVE